MFELNSSPFYIDCGQVWFHKPNDYSLKDIIPESLTRVLSNILIGSITNPDTKEGKDFREYFRTSAINRKSKEFAISIDMAKELSMVSKTDKGRQARRYFIKCEGIAKSLYATRLAGKMARRTLTDSIQDSGENERMHGHAYTTYTKLAYKLTGISTGSRDSLASDDLKRLENTELLMKGLIEAGQTYNEIKDTLKPIFL